MKRLTLFTICMSMNMGNGFPSLRLRHELLDHLLSCSKHVNHCLEIQPSILKDLGLLPYPAQIRVNPWWLSLSSVVIECWEQFNSKTMNARMLMANRNCVY